VFWVLHFQHTFVCTRLFVEEVRFDCAGVVRSHAWSPQSSLVWARIGAQISKKTCLGRFSEGRLKCEKKKKILRASTDCFDSGD
jgi:hypothetical protein